METDDPHPQAFLVIEPDGDAVSVSDVLVTRGLPAFIVGSSDKAHLRLTDADLAPGHVAVRLQNGGYLLQVLPGAACRVNGQPLLRGTLLSPGDVIDLDGVQLRFAADAAPLSAAPPISHPRTAAPAPRPLMQPPARAAAPAVQQAAASAAEPTIYYASQSAPASVNLSGLLYLGIGLITIVLLAVAGITLFPRQTAEADLPLEFAYNDGSVTVVMFDADW
jgi:hypothetical protein